MKTLILTGWGHVSYAIAAALALRHYHEADVLGISIRHLPEFLDHVSGYKEIVITGIGLVGDPELLDKALTKLQKQGIAVHFLTGLAIPDSISESTRSKMDIFYVDGDVSDAVCERYNLNYTDLEP